MKQFKASKSPCRTAQKLKTSLNSSRLISSRQVVRSPPMPKTYASLSKKKVKKQKVGGKKVCELNPDLDRDILSIVNRYVYK
jgi:hypothetical protein